MPYWHIVNSTKSPTTTVVHHSPPITLHIFFSSARSICAQNESLWLSFLFLLSSTHSRHFHDKTLILREQRIILYGRLTPYRPALCHASDVLIVFFGGGDGHSALSFVWNFNEETEISFYSQTNFIFIRVHLYSDFIVHLRHLILNFQVLGTFR